MSRSSLLVLVVLSLLLVLPVSGNHHCVCDNDYGPDSKPPGHCDYGCIPAPCSICQNMCNADGGTMTTCTDGCSGPGGTCQASSVQAGTVVLEKFTKASEHTSSAVVVKDTCTGEFFCPSSDCSGQCYDLVLGSCYAASVSVTTPFNNYKGSAIMSWQISSSSIGIAIFPDGDCSSAPSYSSTLSNSCNSCFPLNVQFNINGDNINTHAYSSPAALNQNGHIHGWRAIGQPKPPHMNETVAESVPSVLIE